MDNLKPNCLIPPELVIKDCDDLLYEIGLCRTSVRDRPKRWPINNPKFITIISLIFFCKSLVAVLVSDSARQILLLMGDVGRFMNIRMQWNLALNLCSQMAISNQLNYYYNHSKGFEPTFLRVFQMMSGSVTPLNIGLTDNRDIRRLLKHKPIFQLLIIQTRYLTFIMTLVFMMTCFILYEDLISIVIYGVPHSLLWAIFVHQFAAEILLQIFYCYMICVYLKSKIRDLNQILNIGNKQNKNISGVQRILEKFDSIYEEIDEYNTTYWSKLLFISWLYLGSIATIILFVVVFISTPLILKVVLIYGVFFIGTSLHFMYATASSLNSEANRSYRPLNSIMAKHSTDSRFVRIARFNQTIKVSLHRQSLLISNEILNILP